MLRRAHVVDDVRASLRVGHADGRRRGQDAKRGFARRDGRHPVVRLGDQPPGAGDGIARGLERAKDDVAVVLAGTTAARVVAPDLHPWAVGAKVQRIVEPLERAVGTRVRHRRRPLQVAANVVVEAARCVVADEGEHTRGIHGDDHDHRRDVPERQRKTHAVRTPPGHVTNSHLSRLNAQCCHFPSPSGSPSLTMNPTPRTV